MEQPELIPHLFRSEFSKITAVLCKTFGIEHIEVAEDIASETFLAAMETWTYRGIPANPTAWLYTVAKNKTKNHLKRDQLFRDKIGPRLRWSEATSQELDIDLSEQNISDSQLQMLFAISHPSIPPEAQVGLGLRTLCGFGIDEIANAFLTGRDTINKRLYRARETLREEHVVIEMPAESELGKRLQSVLTALYLLFNEGYYSESNDSVLREDLCAEAMRLTLLLRANKNTHESAVDALYALMCFHASRFPARKDKNGEIVLYADQDESLWDRELIERGAYHLHEASRGTILTKYHLEAGIAYWHTQKTDSTEKWENILQLYNRLLQIDYSPVAALNRTFALAKANGPAEAIAEAEKLKLENNHFYWALLGELYSDSDRATAIQHFEKAGSLARTNADKQVLRKKIDNLLDNS